MAPTEILAKQHFVSISNLLKHFNVCVGMLTGKDARIFRDGETFEVSKKSFNGDLENGQIDIAIGTHSLIQKNVVFKDLALVILDEQHRFGVEQRDHLIKGQKTCPSFAFNDRHPNSTNFSFNSLWRFGFIFNR